jgi:tRNA (cmo5U34)-methyltransferase
MAEDFTFDSKIAAQYEAGVRQSLPTYDQIFTMIQSYFRVHLGENASILVVGAGGGKELSSWGPSNSKWTFTGVDPSEAMLNIAKQKVLELGFQERVKFIQGTVNDLPRNTKFDAATCILVLHFIHDHKEKLNLLKNVSKHLKPNSPFVIISMFGAPDDIEFQERMSIFKSLWIDAGFTRSEVEEVVNGVMGVSLLPEEQIKELLVEAGFTNISRFFTTTLFGGWICHTE